MKKSIIITLLTFFISTFSYAQLVVSNCSYAIEYNGNTNTSNTPTIISSSSQRISFDIIPPSGLCAIETFNFITSGNSWIRIAQTSSTSVNISISENTSNVIRSGQINGFSLSGIILNIYIEQSGGTGCTNGINYYPDSDGDGLGDYNAVPEYSCTPIFGKVANNSDMCPNDPNSTPDGCPLVSENLNWIQTENFDVLNNSLGSSKSYFDELGKNIQSQLYDIKEQRIWVSQTLYDYLGRGAFKTLIAPITSKNSPQGFSFNFNFIKKIDGGNYSTSDFENGDVFNPPTIKNDINTLGWYYSSSNTDEPYQDVTNRPYNRIIYSKLNPGNNLRVIGGNKLDNEWRQGYSFSMPASQELYYAFGYNEFESNSDVSEIYSNINSSVLNDTNKQIVWLRSSKTIIEDVQGNQTVVFIDNEGKALASARSGGTIKYNVTSLIGKDGVIDIHLPKGCQGTLSFIGGSNNYKVYDLKTETLLTSLSNIPSGFYRVEYTGGANLNETSNLTYINKLNNTIHPVETAHAGVIYKVNYYDFSLNYYNNTGFLIKKLQPLGFNSSSLSSLSASSSHNQNLTSEFEYNSLGQVIYSKKPDAGELWIKYRKNGQIRFSQNSKQLIAGEFSYTNYDIYGRPNESGVAVGNFNNLNPNTSTFSYSAFKERNFSQYDFLINTSELSTLGVVGEHQTPSFLSGKVAKTWKINENEGIVSTNYYSYDAYGRVKWMIQNISGLGVKTLDYENDPVTSNLSKVIYQKNVASELFIHRYTYNVSRQLIRVETSTDGNNYITHAEYDYYENRALKRTELADGIQGIDYVYGLGGQLKAINHPSLSAINDPGGDTNDLFGMTIDYYNNDYTRDSNFNLITTGENQFNGNIKGITSNTKLNGTLQPNAQYVYKYNSNNWLEEATFSGGNAINSSDYKVNIPQYDANGNIKRLIRNKHTENDSNIMDNFTYVYKNTNTSNRLDHINDSVTGTTNADDLKDQSSDNYIYNEIGQLIEDKQSNVKYKYNASGLVTKAEGVFHITNNPYPQSVSFVYDDKGYRVKKTASATTGIGVITTKTYYVRDFSGNVLAIYTDYQNGGANLSELPIYGNDRLGIYKRQNNTSLYQITDHLGNVRAVISKDQIGNTAALVSATDYYPFGMPMPGRQVVGGEPYRYAFQGQEKDSETGKEAFQLRLWDSRIGRWMTTDPYKQYHSPYLGMGNNPINGIDPDGGLFGRIRAWFYKKRHGGEITENEFGKWVWTKGYSQADFDTDDMVHLNGIDIKNFGYAGLGKFTMSSKGNIYSKVDFGLAYAKQGITGIDVKGPTIRLFDTEIGFDSDEGGFKQEMYYLGKDGTLKGSLYSYQVESQKFDYKSGTNWKTTISLAGVITTTEDYGGIGKPFLEAKVDNISKKGIDIHLGFQEDWGQSFGLFKVLGITGKVGFRLQSKIKWEW